MLRGRTLGHRVTGRPAITSLYAKA